MARWARQVEDDEFGCVGPLDDRFIQPHCRVHPPHVAAVPAKTVGRHNQKVRRFWEMKQSIAVSIHPEDRWRRKHAENMCAEENETTRTQAIRMECRFELTKHWTRIAMKVPYMSGRQ